MIVFDLRPAFAGRPCELFRIVTGGLHYPRLLVDQRRWIVHATAYRFAASNLDVDLICADLFPADMLRDLSERAGLIEAIAALALSPCVASLFLFAAVVGASQPVAAGARFEPCDLSSIR